MQNDKKQQLLNEIDIIKNNLLNDFINYDEAIEQILKLAYINNIDSSILYNCLYSSKPELYININY